MTLKSCEDLLFNELNNNCLLEDVAFGWGFTSSYTMRYVPEGGTAVSNVRREKHMLRVKNIRDTKHEYTLDRNGFMISRLPTRLDYAIF